MNFKLLLAVVGLGLLSSLPAHAADIQLNGFASIISGIDLEDEGEDIGTDTSPYSARTVDNLQESRVGLQWSVKLDKGMRFVAQSVSKGSPSTGFEMNLDWSYFDINVGDEGKFKIGRLRIPFYKYSDYLDVGYAYHWITPPKSMYALVFSNIDGLSYQHNFQNSSLEHSINIVFGRYQGELKLGSGNLENTLAINWNASIGNHEFYLAYVQADAYISSEAFVGFPSNVIFDGDTGSFLGAGYIGTFGKVSIYSEISQTDISNAIQPNALGGYLGAAYEMGKYSLHITYGYQEAKAKDYAFSFDHDGDTIPFNAVSHSLGNDLGEGNSGNIIIGVRKDIASQTSLKLELAKYTEDRFQSVADVLSNTKQEENYTTLKLAIETMF